VIKIWTTPADFTTYVEIRRAFDQRPGTDETIALADQLAVLMSSGYPTLDRAAIEAVERWRFQPARRRGYDTGSLRYVPIIYLLDGDKLNGD
jgi:hypothetical protein